MKINVGFLMSYDYEFLKTSIPLVYKSSDKIVIALDENYITWSGNKFEVCPTFFDWLKKIDSENKIVLYEDNFYVPELSAIQNDTRERNLLAKKMGDGLCLQLDADEFMINFDECVEFLKNSSKIRNSKKPIQIRAYWYNMYKQLPDGCLFVKKTVPFYFGSTKANFIRARKNKDQEKFYIPFIAIHQSWGRDEEALKFKLNNWGHNKDFDVEKYLKLWNSVNKENYKDFKYVHPFIKKKWKELSFVEGRTIFEVIDNIKGTIKPPMTAIFFKNLAQRINSISKIG